MNQEKQTFNPNKKRSKEKLSNSVRTALAIGALTVASFIGIETSSSSDDIYSQEGRGTIEMTIAPGEKLWPTARTLAAINNLDTREVLDAIAKHNNIEDPGNIPAGLKIELPDFTDELEDYYNSLDSTEG